MKSRSQNIPGSRERWYTDGPERVPPRYSISTFPNAEATAFTVITDFPLGVNSLPNPHEFSKVEKHMFRGDSLRVWRSSDGTQYRRDVQTGVIVGEHPALPAPIGNDSYNKALAKVYEKVRSGVDLSVSVAEAGQVFKMLKTASKLSHYLLSFHPKNFSSRILEYQLGWRPLVLDLYGAAKLTAEVVPQMMRVTERASANSDRVIMKDLDAWTTSIRNEKQRFRTEIEILYRPSPSTVNSIARFASLNPVSIAWELFPLSFLVDYLYNIGGYLRALETSIVLTGWARGYSTSTSIVDVQEMISGNGKSVSEQIQLGKWSGSNQMKSKKRVTFDSLPIPRLPVLRLNMGASRILTAAALLDVFVRGPQETKGIEKRRKRTRISIDKALQRFKRPGFRFDNDPRRVL